MANRRFKKKSMISIVIPAYKAERFIKRVVNRRLKELDKLGLLYELIVVIDGRSKQSAKQLAEVKHRRLKVFHFSQNRGKGFAVRFGMLNAIGDYVGYIDAGDDVRPGNLTRMIKRIIKGDVDAVIPTKWDSRSNVVYTFNRKLISRFYNFFSRILLGLGVNDTQVGVKIYTKALVDKVFPRILVKRFAFEVEVLAVAKRFGYKCFTTIPVDLEEDAFSTVSLKEGLRSFWDTLAVFYRLRILKYYDKEPRVHNKPIKNEIYLDLIPE